MDNVNYEDYIEDVIDYVSVGERIAALRKKQGITQGDLAERTGIGGKANLSKIENGNIRSLDVCKLVRLADALDCDTDYLLGRIRKITRDNSE